MNESHFLCIAISVLVSVVSTAFVIGYPLMVRIQRLEGRAGSYPDNMNKPIDYLYR